MDIKVDFTQGSIVGKMARFMLPILGALILQSMYGAVDLFIVGRFGTTSGISGVGTGSGVMNLVTILTAGFSTAITVLMGTYIGAKEESKLGKLIGNSIAFFVLVSVILSVLLVVCARPLAILMQAPEDALDLTVDYIRICGLGFVFICFYNFISAIFRGLGDSQTPLLFVAIACVVNMICDYILVAKFNLNVRGAAIATVFAQAVSVLFAVIFIRRKTLPFRLTKKDIVLGSEVRKFVKIGIPLVLQDTLTNLSFLALNAFVNGLGLNASCGYGVANRITSFVLLIPIALIQSMAPFVSQNVGAGKEKRARRGMYTGMLMGLSIGIVVGTFAYVRGDIPSSWFTEDSAVIACSAEYLRGFAPEAVVTAFLFSFLGYFNGHRKSLFVMIQGLIQTFAVRLPLSYLMSVHTYHGLVGIGLAAPAATTVGIIMCFCYYLHLRKSLPAT